MLGHRGALRDWLTKRQLEAAHFWILDELRLSSWPRSNVLHSSVAASFSSGSGWQVDEEEAEDAMTDLIERGLAQEVTVEILARITRVLHSPKGVKCSDLLLPQLGDACLTLRGARVVVSLWEDVYRDYPSTSYVVDEAAGRIRRIYGICEHSIANAVWDRREDVGSFENVGPIYQIGWWRSDWWYLHQSGVAVDLHAPGE